MKRNSFSEIIKSIPNQSKEAILSSLYILPSELRTYLNEHLSTVTEQFIADPVFEPMFGYKVGYQSMGDFSGNLLTKSFVDALDNASSDYCFPKTRLPYLHQIKSWETLLKTDNSLVVSSGTGSGKTECFMIPILSDLSKQLETNNQVLEGVQALFIYPLNALIQSQKERFSEWTKPYKGKIRYCLYNGLLPSKLREHDSSISSEEVVDRAHLWASPAPLLITNTTMLEYMLVRAQDKNILNKSKGKLKYIVLDEAHTYIGSQAAELSLLLKRVMNAFDVTPEKVQFIAISATIGSDKAEFQLKKFLSSISGVNESRITVVFGENQIDPIDEKQNSYKTLEELEQINEDNNDELIKELKHSKIACTLRNYFISEDKKSCCARSLTEIQQKYSLTREEILRWLDLLSATPNTEKPFLPLRLHLFHKTFPGIWACCDPQCSYKDDIEDWKYGKIYLKERCTCDCGAPVFRLITCANCGYPLLEAKLVEVAQTGQKRLQQTMLENIDEFSLEDDDSEILTENEQKVFIDNTQTRYFLNKETGDILHSKDNNDGAIKIGIYENSDDIHCCDNPEINNNYTPIQGAPFFLSVTLPSLLNYADKGKKSEEGPHQSQKMICFTDSRQGTARLAVKLQQNSERNSFRSILLHTVALLTEQTTDNSSEIRTLKEAYKQSPNPLILQLIQAKESSTKINTTHDNITEDIRKKFEGNDFKWINQYYKEKDSVFEDEKGKRNLIEILFAREFARRPKKSVNMETLGLLRTVYDFRKITRIPDVIDMYFHSLAEWKDFLKIIIDFYIRAEGYITYPDNWFKWGAIRKKPKFILPPQINEKSANSWPYAKSKKNKQIINLLCYALDFDTNNDLDRDIINQIMRSAWEALTIETNILTSTNNSEYSMDLCKIGLERPSEIYICPITNKALDVTFKGLSPYSINKNTPKCKKYNIPLYDYSAEIGRSIEECIKKRREWLKNTVELDELKKIGIWSNISNSIIIGNKYFRTAEHSAQQENYVLKKYEEDFKKGKINVLNCSTTMEMGVDIGGITISSMNNVPPHPANYLQRAGRAGRRKETKAICFTMCKNNSHDDYVFEHPKWAFETKINAPYVDQYSFIILQRHINSLLLSYFFESLSESISDGTKLNMEWLMLPKNKNKLCEFKIFCKDAIRTNTRIQHAIKEIIANTGFQDKKIDLFISPLYDMLSAFENSWFTEYDAIQEQKEREKGNKLSFKALELKEKRLTGEYLLKELVEYGILPRYGFPVNIVTFDTKNKNNINEKQHTSREDNMFQRRDLPSRDISTALREYAPGSDVVIDGLVYKSAGITLNWHIPVTDSEVNEIQSIRYIWRCHKCGASGTALNFSDIHCKICNTLIEKRNIIKYIQPAGFAVDFNAPVCNDVSMQTFIPPCEPLITAYSELNSFLGLPYIKYKQDDMGSVIHYSKGGGNGYLLCLECGRMEYNNEKNRKEFTHHYRLRSCDTTKVECHHSPFSIVDEISLGAETKTDVLELILCDLNKKVISDKILAYTLAVAIRNAIAHFLNIETEEIGCNVKRISIRPSNTGYSIELYDINASGYCSSSSIINNLNQILKLAKENLTCDCKLCCNKCLLQNDTKYNYQYLNRELALEFLSDEWIKKNTLTPEMCVFGDSTIIASHSVETTIEEFPNAKYLYMIIPNSSDQDDLINSPIYRLINRCNLKGVTVYICVNKDDILSENIEILNHLAKYKNVYIKSIPQTLDGHILAIIGDGIQSYGYATFDDQVNKANIFWGSNVNTSILSGIINITNYEFSDIKLPTTKDISFDKMYEITNEVDGEGINFGSKLLKIIANNLDMKLKSEKIINITYKDRYLKSPLSFGLLLNFIKTLKNLYSKQWNCLHINVETCYIEETYNQTMFYHDWQNSDIRKKVINSAAKQIGLKLEIQEKDKKYLEHNRCMNIQLSNGEIITLILDQGFSYWRCVPYKHYENMYPFDANEEEQAIKLLEELPYVCGDKYPTRIFFTSKKGK